MERTKLCLENKTARALNCCDLIFIALANVPEKFPLRNRLAHTGYRNKASKFLISPGPTRETEVLFGLGRRKVKVRASGQCV